MSFKTGSDELNGIVTITDSVTAHPPFISASHLECETLTLIYHNEEEDTKRLHVKTAPQKSKL